MDAKIGNDPQEFGEAGRPPSPPGDNFRDGSAIPGDNLRDIPGGDDGQSCAPAAPAPPAPPNNNGGHVDELWIVPDEDGEAPLIFGTFEEVLQHCRFAQSDFTPPRQDEQH